MDCGVTAVLLALFLPVVLGCDTECVFQAVSSTASYYNGTVNKSINGKTCCPWTTSDAQSGMVAGTNYCRNHLDDRNMYCFVGNCAAPTLEYCDVGTFWCPICSSPVVAPTPSSALTYPCVAPQALASTGTSFIPRIVGGSGAIPHEFPFFASVQRNQYLCGGTLIHKDWILTAAHCTYEFDESETPLSAFTIKLGVHNWNDMDSCVETRSVVEIIRKPGYDPATKANDLAFLKLSESSNYPPITLNYQGLTTEDLEAEGLMVTVIGHGALSETANVASLSLQKALLPIFNQDNCRTFWLGPVDSTKLCAAYQQGTVDTCVGDSGGPMFVKRGTTFIQIGVTSFGIGCALPNIPAVYMRLSAFHEWICQSSGLPQEICQRTIAPTAPPSTRRPTSAAPTRFCNSLARCYDCNRAGCGWFQNRTAMGCVPKSSCTDPVNCPSVCPEARSSPSFCTGYCGAPGRISCLCTAGCQGSNCCRDFNYSCPAL